MLTLCLGVGAQMTRMTRAALIGVLDTSYVEMARLKGLSQTRIVLRHALPNAAGPIANAAALSLSSLLGGVIIVEVIFNYPGLAKLMVDAVSTPRHAADPGLRHDLLHRLHGAGAAGGSLLRAVQPAIAPGMSATLLRTRPRRRSGRIAGWAGLAVLVFCCWWRCLPPGLPRTRRGRS